MNMKRHLRVPAMILCLFSLSPIFAGCRGQGRTDGLFVFSEIGALELNWDDWTEPFAIGFGQNWLYVSPDSLFLAPSSAWLASAPSDWSEMASWFQEEEDIQTLSGHLSRWYREDYGEIEFFEFNQAVTFSDMLEKANDEEGMPLFDDGRFLITDATAEINRSGSVTWTTRLAGDDEGFATFVVNEDNSMIGILNTSDGIFKLETIQLSDGNLLHALISVTDDILSPPDHPDGGEIIPTDSTDVRPPNDDGALPPNNLDSDPNKIVELTLLVGYTDNLIYDDPQEYYSNWVEFSNTTFGLSNLPIRIKVLSTILVDYTETGNLSQDKDSLLSGAGDLKTLHSLRDTLSANMAALVVYEGIACGESGANYANRSKAFFVFRDSDACNAKYVIAHEVGHILGAAHNPESGTDHRNKIDDFGHGYLNLGKGWGTIMSNTNRMCANNKCLRIPLWSSPMTQWRGFRTGTPTLHDNARVLLKRARIVASY